MENFRGPGEGTRIFVLRQAADAESRLDFGSISSRDGYKIANANTHESLLATPSLREELSGGGKDCIVR